MRRFIYKLIFFLFVPFILILVPETYIYFSKDKLFSEDKLELLFEKEKSKYDWINEFSNDSLNVLAGSSSVRYGLSCSELNTLSHRDSSYVNIAMDARDPTATYYILKHLNPEKISTIYFGLDPWIYSKKYYRHRHRYLYLDFSTLEAFRYFRNVDKSTYYKRYVSLFTSHSDKYGNAKVNLDDFGSVALTRVPKNFDTENIRSVYQIEDYGWSELQFSHLKKLEDYCREKNISFEMFVPPKRSDYSEIFKSQNMDILQDFMQHLDKIKISSKIFGKFDQLNDYGDSDLFAEPVHLNDKGQKVYSKVFYEMTASERVSFSKKYSWFQY